MFQEVGSLPRAFCVSQAADQPGEMRSDAGGENPDPLAPTLGQDGLAVPVVPSEHLVTTKAGQGHRKSRVTGKPGHEVAVKPIDARLIESSQRLRNGL